MFNIEKVPNEILEVAEKKGIIVDYDVFKDAEEAEHKGFYWYDEIGKWVKPDELESLNK